MLLIQNLWVDCKVCLRHAVDLRWKNLLLVIVQSAIHFDDVSEANGGGKPHIFAWATWPEALWPRGIMIWWSLGARQGVERNQDYPGASASARRVNQDWLFEITFPCLFQALIGLFSWEVLVGGVCLRSEGFFLKKSPFSGLELCSLKKDLSERR